MFTRSRIAPLLAALMLCALVGCHNVTSRSLASIKPITFTYEDGNSKYVATVCSSSFTVYHGENDVQIEIIDGWILIHGLNPMIGTKETIAGTEGKLAALTSGTSNDDPVDYVYLFVRTPDGLDVVQTKTGDVSIVGRYLFNHSRKSVVAGTLKGSHQTLIGNAYCTPDSAVRKPDLTLSPTDTTQLNQLIQQINDYMDDLQTKPCVDD